MCGGWGTRRARTTLPARFSNGLGSDSLGLHLPVFEADVEPMAAGGRWDLAASYQAAEMCATRPRQYPAGATLIPFPLAGQSERALQITFSRATVHDCACATVDSPQKVAGPHHCIGRSARHLPFLHLLPSKSFDRLRPRQTSRLRLEGKKPATTCHHISS